MALVQPQEWISIPTYESYVYHVYALEETEGSSGLGLGDVLLQHRVGLIPLGKKGTEYKCAGAKAKATTGGGTARHEDVQPYSEVLEQQQEEFGRPTTKSRHWYVWFLFSFEYVFFCLYFVRRRSIIYSLFKRQNRTDLTPCSDPCSFPHDHKNDTIYNTVTLWILDSGMKRGVHLVCTG